MLLMVPDGTLRARETERLDSTCRLGCVQLTCMHAYVQLSCYCYCLPVLSFSGRIKKKKVENAAVALRVCGAGIEFDVRLLGTGCLWDQGHSGGIRIQYGVHSTKYYPREKKAGKKEKRKRHLILLLHQAMAC